MSAHVWHGPWVNWSHGLIQGATITLGERAGGLLTAFIATFVTIVGAELWKIICYFLHQVRSSQKPQDGLYHQQQVILRTSPTPGGASWLFLQQSWAWAGRARLSLLRTLPWAVFSLVYIIIIGLVAIFSSEISKSPGPQRLYISDDCGIWRLNSSSPYSTEAFATRATNDSLTAATYAQACYGGSLDPLACSKMPVPNIGWTANLNATCPFQSGTCLFGDTAAYGITSQLIDSHHDLGINAPRSARVQVQKTTTCAPLSAKSFAVVVNATDDPDGLGRAGDTIIKYYYGPIVETTNFTYFYNDHMSFDNFGYTLSAQQATAGAPLAAGSFEPVPAINTTTADLSLLFIAANSVVLENECDDPIFGAHTFVNTTSLGYNIQYWSPDYYVNVLACAEQYKICNPTNNKCTDNLGVTQLFQTLSENNDLSFNAVQSATASRLISALQVTSIYYATFTRLGNALRATASLSTLSQRYLPPNQWHIEAGSWFDAGLARLQQKVLEYATGPALVPEGSYVVKPNSAVAADIPWRAMCDSQLINDSSNSMSFSVLGLGILFGFGLLIIFVSLIIDTLVGWIQARFHKGLHARMEWLVSDKLQMQRLLYDATGMGRWEDSTSTAIPVTEKGQEKFLGAADRSLKTGSVENVNDGADAQLVEEHFDAKEGNGYH